MEYTIIEKIITQMGIPGIGFAFLGYFLKRYFDEGKENRILKEKELQKESAEINKLCNKIDSMTDAISEFTSIQLQKSVDLNHMFADMKDMYIRIAHKQENIKQTIDNVHTNTKFCPNINNIRKERKLDED